MSRGDRESELLDTLEAVIGEELPYVLVGGWAISAFQPRFSVDVDVVSPSEALSDFRDLLAGRGYEQVADVETTPVYQGRTVRFEKDVSNPVTFDLMLDSWAVDRPTQSGRSDTCSSIHGWPRSKRDGDSTFASRSGNSCLH